MQTFSAIDAKARFGELLDLAQRAPVRVVRDHQLEGVMVSAQDYGAMRVFYADRLRQSLREGAQTAGDADLTDEGLDGLLADES